VAKNGGQAGASGVRHGAKIMSLYSYLEAPVEGNNREQREVNGRRSGGVFSPIQGIEQVS